MLRQNITTQIIAWLADSANNVLAPDSPFPAFEAPLVGAAAGDDPLFAFLKKDIGEDFYWTPEEAFKRAFPQSSVDAGELTVLAWVLPQTERTRLAHRKERELPSMEWSCARCYGEKVNENLRRYVVEFLATKGVDACAPVLSPAWEKRESRRYGFASSWSERHTAHVCGLGTFGLSDGLITPKGKAIRVGSVILQAQLPPTPRPYSTHNEWCLFYAKGKCRACIKRCPVGAISEAGHDKKRCKEYIRNVTATHVEREQLGVRVNSCGLCQTKVPCEGKNPVGKIS